MTDLPGDTLGPDAPANQAPQVSLGVGVISAIDAPVTQFGALSALLVDCNFIEGQKVLHANHDLLAKVALFWSDPEHSEMSDEDNLVLSDLCRELILKLNEYSPDGYQFGENDRRELGWWPV